MPDDLRVSFPRPCDEKWEAMTPAGCDRVCARCDTVIHDLSMLDFDEAEALLRRNPGTCVRASIDAGGVVALKLGRGGSMRRMVIAAGLSASLLASGPALAVQKRPQGSITGTTAGSMFPVRVVATNATGKSFRATAKGPEGIYRFKHVPAGTYKLTFTPDCGGEWTIENVVVGGGETVVPDSSGENDCVIVGMLVIEEGRG